MMNCAPDRCSNAASFPFSASASLPLRIPALSVTHAVGGGGTSSANALVATANRSRTLTIRARTARLPSSCGCRRRLSERLEIHLGRHARSGHSAEIRLRFESAHVRDNVRRKLEHGRIELLRDFVESPAF